MNRHCLFVLINFSVKFPATKKKTDYDSKLKQKKIFQIAKNTETKESSRKFSTTKKFPNIMNMMMMINNNNEEKKEKDYLNY